MELTHRFDNSDAFTEETPTVDHTEEPTLPPGQDQLLKLMSVLSARPDLLELCVKLSKFGDGELAGFDFIASKHAAGRERYGELRVAEDGRDFLEEAAEEGADLLNYLAFEFVKRVAIRKKAA